MRHCAELSRVFAATGMAWGLSTVSKTSSVFFKAMELGSSSGPPTTT